MLVLKTTSQAVVLIYILSKLLKLKILFVIFDWMKWRKRYCPFNINVHVMTVVYLKASTVRYRYITNQRLIFFFILRTRGKR